MATRYEIVFTRPAYGHLEALRPYDRNAVLDAVKEQLMHAPSEKTRNRKSLRENPLADWELRIGQHRVFYDVDASQGRVRVVAVGTKEGNKLLIGGKEVKL